MPPEYDKKKQNKLFRGLGVGALAVATLVGGYFAVGSGKSNPNQQPVATAPANPTETAAKTPAVVEASKLVAEVLPTVESLEISADGTNEQIAQSIISELDTLSTTGMNKDVYEAYFKVRSTNTEKGFAINYLKPYVENYFTAFCGSDYKTNPNLDVFAATLSESAAINLANYIATMSFNDTRSDGAANTTKIYEARLTYDKLVSGTLGSVFVISSHDTCNARETILGKYSPIPDARPDKQDDLFKFDTTIRTNASGKKIVNITGFSFTTTYPTSSNK